MGRHLAVLVLCSLCAGLASADLAFDLVAVDKTSVTPGDDPLVPDFNDGSYFTFDLLVTVTDSFPEHEDDWLGGGVSATLSGPAEFFQHAQGGDLPPDEGLIDEYPAVEFDSYFRGAPGHEIIFAWGPSNEPTSIYAEWADPEYAGNGSYPIARYTAQWLGGEAAVLTVEGMGISRNYEHPFFVGPFTVTIPEPSTLALLALGAFAALRRR